MKTLVRKALQSIGKALGINIVGNIRRFSGKLIELIYKSTGVSVMHPALNQLGILKGTTFDKSGEQFLIQEVILNHIQPHETIIDVGANTGSYTRQLISYFPNNRIISFEPNPSAFELLVEITGTEAYQKACGRKNEERRLYFESNKKASSHASFSGEEFITEKTMDYVTVKCVRLEDEMNRLKAEPVGFLKVDAEGHDFEVLEGLGDKLQKIKFIQFEFNEFHVFSRTFIRDFHTLLSPSHDLFRIDTGRLHDLRVYNPYQEIFRYQNLVAIHKTITPEVSRHIK